MTDRVMFCYKNKINEQQSNIFERIKRGQQDIDMIPVYCMKLCFLCHSQYLLVLNDSLIVSPNEEGLWMKMEESLKE